MEDDAVVVAGISRIMSKVGSIEKKGTNTFHKYDYVKASDVTLKLQGMLAEEGLVIVPHEVERQLLAGELMSISYEMIVQHTSGVKWSERPIKTGMAAARNSKGGFDDKASNKCGTAAEKYFLLQLFKIPTTDFDDADAQEDRPKVAPPPPAPAPIVAASERPSVMVAPCVLAIPTNGNDGQKDYIAWGQAFIAGIANAHDLEDIWMWGDMNSEALAEIGKNSQLKKLNDRLQVRVNEKRKPMVDDLQSMLASEMAKFGTVEELNKLWDAIPALDLLTEEEHAIAVAIYEENLNRVKAPE